MCLLSCYYDMVIWCISNKTLFPKSPFLPLDWLCGIDGSGHWKRVYLIINSSITYSHYMLG